MTDITENNVTPTTDITATDEVSAREEVKAVRPVYVYRHYDAAGVLLYVGKTVNPSKRTSDHINGADWRDQISTINRQPYPNEAEALKAERKAILTEHPLHNKLKKLKDVYVFVTGVVVGTRSEASQKRYDILRIKILVSDFNKKCKSGRFKLLGFGIHKNRTLPYPGAVFAWIGRNDFGSPDKENNTVIVDIGFAYAFGKPIFIAFEDKGLADEYAYARGLADLTTIAPSAAEAWKVFTAWRDEVDPLS